MTSPGSPPPPAARGSAWRAFAGPVAGLLLVMALGRLAGAHWPAIEAWIADLGAWGYLAFCAAWVALSSLCFPVSVFGISAGVLFGLPLGLGLVFVSANLAALVMFGLGRTLMRGRIRNFLATRPKLAAIDRLAGEKALRLNLLTRLSPLNYGLACYTLAAGRTRLRTYLAGNLATVPSMVLQVWLGTLAVQTGRASGDDRTRNLVLLGIGLLVVAVLGWRIRRLVTQALADVEDTAGDDTAPKDSDRAAPPPGDP